MQTHKIAGKVMETLEAFHGSRPALDANNILIVRGMSRKKFDSDKISDILSDLLKKIGAQEIDMFSQEGGSIIGIMDERIRSSVPIQGETDVSGIQAMKSSLEAMNCNVDVVMGVLNDMGVFIVTWDEKGGIGIRFVEVVVANLE
ncbi:DUF2120 family protein [Methanobacterium sp. ACI-7]|uniref:DUF2120 family protein n=1 Tax=unclassified Methanobacterium TaxID=2627676 RepID=UPI0039C22D5B